MNFAARSPLGEKRTHLQGRNTGLQENVTKSARQLDKICKESAPNLQERSMKCTGKRESIFQREDQTPKETGSILQRKWTGGPNSQGKLN